MDVEQRRLLWSISNILEPYFLIILEIVAAYWKYIASTSVSLVRRVQNIRVRS